MLILAFDTTSERGGAAIFRDRACLASLANQGPPNYYSVTLFQIVEQLLRQTDLSLPDIDLFAVVNGPGSFTGIRVGLAAAQGWATVLRRPVKGISALECMVEEARPAGDWVVPLVDARRGEFYLGLFRPKPAGPGKAFTAQGHDHVLKPDAVIRFFEELSRKQSLRSQITCVVRDHDQPALALTAQLAEFARCEVRGPLLQSLAGLALRASEEGSLQFPNQLEAYYIRRSDAEIRAPKGGPQHGQ